MNRRQYLAHAAWFAALLAVTFAVVWFTTAPPAGAEPAPPGPPAAECYEDQPCWDPCTMGNRRPCPPSAPPGFASGWVACGDQLIPADPRVDMQNPIGSLIYRRLLEAMCPTQGGAQ